MLPYGSLRSLGLSALLDASWWLAALAGPVGVTRRFQSLAAWGLSPSQQWSDLDPISFSWSLSHDHFLIPKSFLYSRSLHTFFLDIKIKQSITIMIYLILPSHLLLYRSYGHSIHSFTIFLLDTQIWYYLHLWTFKTPIFMTPYKYYSWYTVYCQCLSNAG